MKHIDRKKMAKLPAAVDKHPILIANYDITFIPVLYMSF